MPQSPTQLIATVRSLDAAAAALGSGATTIHFDLREKIANGQFDTGEVSRTARLAHGNGAECFLAADMVILPGELPQVLAFLLEGCAQGADGVSISDLGLIAQIAEANPAIRVHVSSRANVHDASTVRAFAALGAERIALSRELTLANVEVLTAVAREVGAEVEVFAHGPSCVSYAGQCVLSAMTGQGSDNRGRCAGLCRSRYEMVDLKHAPIETKGPYLLSVKDTALYAHVGSLVAAGVAALRIGGSDRTDGAIAATVSAYSRALRAAASGAPLGADLAAQIEESLSTAFNRGFTSHLLEGDRTADALAIRRPDNAGVMVGRVGQAAGNRATLNLTDELRNGDIIEVRTRRGSFTQEVSGLEGVAAPGSNPTIKMKSYVGKGDRIFRLRSAALEAAAAGRAAQAKSIRIPLDFVVTAQAGSPFTVFVADAAGVTGSAEGPIVELARTKPLTAEEVHAHIDRLGGTPFRVGQMEITVSDGVGLRFSDIHRTRTAAIQDYQETLRAMPASSADVPAAAAGMAATGTLPEEDTAAAADSGASLTAPVAAAATATKRTPRESFEERRSMYVAASVEAPGAARAAVNAGAAVAFAPALNLVDEEPTPGVAALLPRACSDAEFDTYIGVAERFGGAVASTLGQLATCVQRGIPVSANSSLNVTNAAAVNLLADMGADFVWLSPELSGNQIAEVARAVSVPVGIQAAGLVEVLVSEHCVLQAAYDCDRRCDRCKYREEPVALKDEREYNFPLRVDSMGRSHLYNSVPLDLSRQLNELVTAGVAAVRTDLNTALTSSVSGEVAKLRRQITDTYAGADPAEAEPHTTTGRYYRGIGG